MPHYVKCRFCGEKFDRDKEPFEIKSKNWYYHKHCFEEMQNTQSQKDKDLEALYQYCNKLFGKEFQFKITERLIKKYHTEYGYTYTGILRTLKYFYEVQGNSIEKSNGSIAIVPYIYDQAYQYYYNIWLANQTNEVKILSHYEPETIQIKIPVPQRIIPKRKMFQFLDEENEDGK